MSGSGSLVGRDLLSVADLSTDEVGLVFATATRLKAEYREHRRHLEPPLVGRTLAMLFQKPSLRTRVTFDAGMTQLGGSAIYLTNDTVLGARESVRDVARNLERFVDAIVARTGPHEVVVELASQAAHPRHQRPDASRASVPGPGRCLHDRGAPGRLAGAKRRVRRRRQQRLPLAGAARGGDGHGDPDGAPGRVCPERADRGEGGGTRRSLRRPPRVRIGPDRHRPRCRRRLHRRLDVDGPGSRDRGATGRLRRLPGRTTP